MYKNIEKSQYIHFLFLHKKTRIEVVFNPGFNRNH